MLFALYTLLAAVERRAQRKSFVIRRPPIDRAEKRRRGCEHEAAVAYQSTKRPVAPPRQSKSRLQSAPESK